ncbi:LptF/LptG family permease [bacterium NHP-B]|nr:LptF/LptG family permease [bacterium NHP-B]
MRILRSMTLHLLGTTVLLSLFIASLLWMKQSFRFVSIIVVQRLSFLDFFLFVTWLLPELFSLALPFAFFIAVLFLYGRYRDDNILSVLKNAGYSQARILRPVIYVGMAGTLFLYLMTLYFVPLSFQKFRKQELSMRSHFSEKSFQVGAFKSLGPFTVYVRNKRKDGSLDGLFIYDQRHLDKQASILASRAQVINDGERIGLCLQQGVRQTREDARYSFFDFDRYIFYAKDAHEKTAAPIKSYELFLSELFTTYQTLEEKIKFHFEAFQRLLLPLYFLSFGMVAGLFMCKTHSKKWNITAAVLAFLSIQFGSLVLLQLEGHLGLMAPILAFTGVLSPLFYVMYQHLKYETLSSQLQLS